MFERSEDVNAKWLSYLFAEYFIQAPVPFLIIPPSHIELDGIWNGVYEDAKRDRDHAESLIDHFKNLSPKDLDDLDQEELLKLCEELVQYEMGGETATSELKRASRMLESGCLRRLDAFPISDMPDLALPHENSQHTMKRHLTYWRRGLNRIRPGKEFIINNESDAQVLSRLQWINEELKRKKENTKICFVTGDRHIERLAGELKIDRSTFAESYIRPPLCFLADIEFFHRIGISGPRFSGQDQSRIGTSRFLPPTTRANLADWLDVLLTHSDEQRAGGRHRLSSDVMRGSYSRPLTAEISNSLRTEWNVFLQFAASGVAVSDQVLKQRVIELAQTLRSSGWRKLELESLRMRIKNASTSSIERFFAASALAGFWQLSVPERLSRGIPAIKFDSFKSASEIAAKLRLTHRFSDLQQDASRLWLRALYRDDTSGYTTFLVFALAFAAAGQWQAASKIAHYAYNLASQTRSAEAKAYPSIKGDEAAYLYSICLRHCAHDSRDVGFAGWYLSRAIELASKDPRRQHYYGVDYRFESEKIAQDLTVLFFKSFCKDTEKDAKARPLRNIGTRIRNLLKQPLRVERWAHVREFVNEQLVINLLQARLLATISGEKLGISDAECRRYLVDYVKNVGSETFLSNTTDHKPISQLVRSVVLTSSLVLDKALLKWNEQEVRKNHISTLQAIRDHDCLMPYDRKKFECFLDIVTKGDGHKHKNAD